MLRSTAVTPVMVDAVLAELPPLISESDMHVSQMALSFLSTLAVTHPASLGQLSGGNILQQLITLVRSPLLQGGALSAMLDFYQVSDGAMGGGGQQRCDDIISTTSDYQNKSMFCRCLVQVFNPRQSPPSSPELVT